MNLNKTLRTELTLIALRKSGFSGQLRNLILEKQQLALEIWEFAFGGKNTPEDVSIFSKELADAVQKANSQLNGNQVFGLTVNMANRVYVYRDNTWLGTVEFNGDIFWDSYGKDRKRNYPNRIWLLEPNPTISLPVGSTNLTLPEKHHFTQKVEDVFMRFSAQETKLKDSLDGVYTAVLSKLESYRTIKQLLEHWPEAEELVAELPPVKAAPSLPAITTERLNTLIGLPSGK